MLHTSIWQNEEFALLSDKAKILYIGTITLADDEGRLKANSMLLRSQVFPLDENVKSEEVRKWMNELVKVKLVTHYEADGQHFIQHPNWNKFQTLRMDRMRRSDIPAPEGMEGKIMKLFPNNANLPRELLIKIWDRDGEACRYCGKNQKPFHIDHVIPVSRGGKNTLENLVVSCEKCNTTKKDRLLEEIGWKLLPCPTYDGQLSVNGRHKISKDKISKDNNARKRAPSPPKKKLEDPTPMNLEEYVTWMKSSDQRHIQIIGEWAEAEGPAFETKGQWESFTARNLRIAKTLVPYSTKQIEKAYHLMLKDLQREENGKKVGFITKYTLETLTKYIDRI